MVKILTFGTAVDLVQLRSLWGSTARHCVDQYSILFQYYSLGATLLCHAGYTLGSATHFQFSNLCRRAINALFLFSIYQCTKRVYSHRTDHGMHICHIQCWCFLPSRTDSTYDIELAGKLNIQQTHPYCRLLMENAGTMLLHLLFFKHD